MKAFDLLPIGVGISRGPNGELLRNRIAVEMTGVRHVDILVDDTDPIFRDMAVQAV